MLQNNNIGCKFTIVSLIFLIAIGSFATTSQIPKKTSYRKGLKKQKIQETMPQPIQSKDPSPQPETIEPERQTEELQGWLVRPLIQWPMNIFYAGSPDVNNVALLPNVGPAIGAKVMWKNFGLSAVTALPLPRSEIDRRGNTRAQSFVFSTYRKGHSLDFYYQRYNGLYMSRILDEFDLNKSDRYPKLPDARLENYGINYYYNFNPEAISLRAAFDQTEFQSWSGGSWILSPFYNRLKVSAGTSFTPGSSPHFPDQPPKFAAGTYDNLGATLGYGHIWVWLRYVIGFYGGVGPAVQYANFYKDTSVSTQRFGLAGKINSLFTAGYNGPQLQYGMKVFADSISSDSGGIYMANTLLVGTLYMGWKF